MPGSRGRPLLHSSVLTVSGPGLVFSRAAFLGTDAVEVSALSGFSSSGQSPLSEPWKENSSRLERDCSYFGGVRHGVLLVLMTADTRSGTDTAKGLEMFRALRW